APQQLTTRLAALAVDVELELVRSAVPDPHRPRAAVAGEVLERALGRGLVPVHVVEHLQLRLREARGVDEPRQERGALLPPPHPDPPDRAPAVLDPERQPGAQREQAGAGLDSEPERTRVP